MPKKLSPVEDEIRIIDSLLNEAAKAGGLSPFQKGLKSKVTAHKQKGIAKAEKTKALMDDFIKPKK